MSTRGQRHRDVVITGLGMVTPAGADTATAWKATCAGLPSAAPDARLGGTAVDFSCAVTDFDAGLVLGTEARRMDVFTQYAVAAAREAVADAALGDGGWDPTRVGVLIGTGVGGLGTWLEQSGRLLGTPPRPVNPLTVPKAIGNVAAATVALDLGLNGPALSLATACATGTNS
ncbi:beta-ketoacyl synthase N-terminal-like domain-containing protein [Streptomyces sp. KMM 9044]|uniref:beta-ketoacyl synthase N-terminal-like domain-containing protein n=1 Tax=Streptomyces sp. KMM 9044 TaxID=2744474 RepID=UPI00215098E7|nr:beta-ketoacyl synthase N-terminal-like domain-containing protein [Streptomyces sp. KMM 9044]WAX77128.1 beta-ketoacyl synthase N-terminal-like domain-containing protein [Streptomyces sp. KMM 9044]